MRALVNLVTRGSILFLLGGAWCGCSSRSGDADDSLPSNGGASSGSQNGAHAGAKDLAAANPEKVAPTWRMSFATAAMAWLIVGMIGR